MLHSFIKKFTKNPNNLPMLMLTYCIAVPVPHIPVSPDSHKNFVNVSSLVRLYVIVLDRVYWQFAKEACEWIGVWANPVKLNSLAFWAHHLMVWNQIYQRTRYNFGYIWPCFTVMKKISTKNKIMFYFKSRLQMYCLVN